MSRVLFVCLGNICRSPMAEAVMRHKVEAAGLQGRIEVDSAGTGSWHVGEPADIRTIQVLSQKGIAAPSRARQVTSADFSDFDMIYAMDRQNLRDLTGWPGSNPRKLGLLLSLMSETEPADVPDPYYGGRDGFGQVFRLIDDATDRLMANLERMC